MGCYSMPKGGYTAEFKKQVAETMQKEKLSYCETARQFEISDHKRVAGGSFRAAHCPPIWADNGLYGDLQDTNILERS